MVALGVLTGLGGCEPQLEVHINAALNVGLTPAQFVEALLHAAVYCGIAPRPERHLRGQESLRRTRPVASQHEDRLALHHLRARPDTTGQVASIGLSGGGCRSILLRATSHELTAAVVVGMMGSYDSLLDHNVIDHTWMLLAARADWPDLAACQAPAPLLIQYNRHDELFPIGGAQAAHDRITAHYADSGTLDAYTGRFYDGPHKFDQAMQRDAFAWLTTQLH